MVRSTTALRVRLALLAMTFVLAACGTGRTMITTAPASRQAAESLAMVEGESTAVVPLEVKAALRKQLEQALYDQAKFARGTDLTLRYRFVQFTEGDRFKRWFWGGVGNSGEGSMTVECVFVDRAGQERARIMSEGRIGSGFFGGSMESALEKVVEEISKYTTSNFR
jgi:hypothetical protein